MNLKNTHKFAMLTMLMALAVGSILANPQSKAIIQINDVFVNAAAQSIPAVVTVITERLIRSRGSRQFFDFWGEDEESPRRERIGTILGSGVIIDAKKGYIVTNHHVIDDATEIRVQLHDRRELIAEIVAFDRQTDLAIIKIDAKNLIQIALGDSDKLRIGEWVLAIGSPFNTGLEHTVTAGIVSGKGRSSVLSRRDIQTYEDFIQTDAAINPGNSGGALVNLSGELVGINTAIATDGLSRSSAGVGFAIPINLVKRITEDLIATGKVERAKLGVQVSSLNATLAKAIEVESMRGALIRYVEKGSAADKADLLDGDLIVKVDDFDIRDPSHLTNVISTSRPGDSRKITYIRKGKKRTVTVKLDELEAPPVLARTRSRNNADPMVELTGFTVVDIDSRAANRFDISIDYGVVVNRLNPRGSAWRSGIREGNVIIRLGDEKIENKADFERALNNYKSGDTILLRVVDGDLFRFVGLELS